MSPSRFLVFGSLAGFLVIAVWQLPGSRLREQRDQSVVVSVPDWQMPDTTTIPASDEGELIRYGRNLIANTSYYLGPHGTVAHLSNGMNCQNCHLEAGSRPFSNCLSAVASTYPAFRPRSGIVESIEFRVNDCMLRSMNGKKLDTASREMHAMVAYLKWMGKDVPKGVRPRSSGTIELTYLGRSCDPVSGRKVYMTHCLNCHGRNGEGLMKPTGEGYIYPPLWGESSYNTGAGLYRLGRFAGFIKSCMPFGTTTAECPLLTDEEVWDVAAYVNSQPRPEKKFSEDWPDVRRKAIDYPYGPYADNFSESQHKYGPFGPIRKMQDSLLKK